MVLHLMYKDAVKRLHFTAVVNSVLSFMPISLTDPIGLRMRHLSIYAGASTGVFLLFPQSLVLARRWRNATLHCAIAAGGPCGEQTLRATQAGRIYS
jgi:hypothetical protein